MGNLEHLLALEEQHYILLAAALLLEEPEPENMPRRRVCAPRRYWVKPWLLRRPLFGQYENLFYELHEIVDRKGYQNFLRMSPELFNELVEVVVSFDIVLSSVSMGVSTYILSLRSPSLSVSTYYTIYSIFVRNINQ